MDNFKNFLSALQKAKNAVLVSHVNPDGDTLGSTLALGEIIEQCCGFKPDMLICGEVPEIYKFLPNIDKVKRVEDINKDFVYDISIAIDVAAVDRMSYAYDIYQNAKIKINFDHHKTNKQYGTMNFVDPNASATGQVIFDFANSMGLNLNKDIATCIYCAILTDTGCFRFRNTTEKTFITASELIKFGIDTFEISRNCYDSKPKQMVMLHAYAINKAKFLEDGKIAYTILTLNDMKNFNASSQDTEGISEALRQIITTEVAMLLKETASGYTKVSLRSKNIDIARIAEKFDGGGHTLAAGCTIKKPVSIALEKLYEEIKKQL